MSVGFRLSSLKQNFLCDKRAHNAILTHFWGISENVLSSAPIPDWGHNMWKEDLSMFSKMGPQGHLVTPSRVLPGHPQGGW